jgi:hypothetical protein
MNPPSVTSSRKPDATSPPWWRVGMVWLVLGGPALVVVAGLVTAAIAVDGAEEVLTRPPAELKTQDAKLLPAMQGRNHAATPKP